MYKICCLSDKWEIIKWKRIYFAENVGKSKCVFKAFSFNDLSVITGPKITILIHLTRTY